MTKTIVARRDDTLSTCGDQGIPHVWDTNKTPPDDWQKCVCGLVTWGEWVRVLETDSGVKEETKMKPKSIELKDNELYWLRDKAGVVFIGRYFAVGIDEAGWPEFNGHLATRYQVAEVRVLGPATESELDQQARGIYGNN